MNTVQAYEDEQTLPCARSGARILLAEDDGDLRALLGTILRLDGHVVVEACNGADMLRELRPEQGEADFDLVVTDVRMPGFSGLDVVERFRACGGQAPVIAITSFPDAGLQRLADRLDTLLVAKPFSLEAFNGAVDFYLRLMRGGEGSAGDEAEEGPESDSGPQIM